MIPNKKKKQLLTYSEITKIVQQAALEDEFLDSV